MVGGWPLWRGGPGIVGWFVLWGPGHSPLVGISAPMLQARTLGPSAPGSSCDFGPCVTASSAGVLSSGKRHQGRVRGADGEMGGKEHRAGGGGEDVMGKQAPGHQHRTGSPVPRPLLSCQPSVLALQKRGSSCPPLPPQPLLWG